VGITRERWVLGTLDSICRQAGQVVFALYPDVGELKVVRAENGKAQVHYVTQLKDRWFRDEAARTTLARICEEVERGVFPWHTGLREFKIVRRANRHDRRSDDEEILPSRNRRRDGADNREHAMMNERNFYLERLTARIAELRQLGTKRA
jgi:hypothetical protein